mmetsp:Transcript_28050/g.50749  ORF Transcript_28050/g.50749 Transcript_28050/m.50749 type:complete len:253 (+) Transcript_28050:935-1693(+)
MRAITTRIRTALHRRLRVIRMSIIIISPVVNVGGIVTTNPRPILRAPAVVAANGIDPAAGRGIANDVGAANVGPVETLPNAEAAATILRRGTRGALSRHTAVDPREVVGVGGRGAVVRRVRVPDRIGRRVVMRRTDRIDQVEVGRVIGAGKVIGVGRAIDRMVRDRSVGVRGVGRGVAGGSMVTVVMATTIRMGGVGGRAAVIATVKNTMIDPRLRPLLRTLGGCVGHSCTARFFGCTLRISDSCMIIALLT